MKEEDQNRLLRGYEQMLHRLREMMDQPDHLTRPRFRDALETAKRQSVEQGELTPDEADRIGDYLRRDLEQAAQFTAKSDQDLGGWLHMDLQLIEDWLLDQFSKAADLTKIEFMNFQRGLAPAEVYVTGEVAGPGALRCSNCGNSLHFERVDHIPACPNCGNQEFIRPAAGQPEA
jgi:predicted RNA-binding Zn-ribbon protein involved in translation (DUF1610 family)